MSATVADEKKPKKGGGDAEAYTTLRVFEPDGNDLSDLSRLDGVTIAKTYEEYVRPVIRKILRERLQERLKKMGP